jgi:hypothetical protein
MRAILFAAMIAASGTAAQAETWVTFANGADGSVMSLDADTMKTTSKESEVMVKIDLSKVPGSEAPQIDQLWKVRCDNGTLAIAGEKVLRANGTVLRTTPFDQKNLRFDPIEGGSAAELVRGRICPAERDPAE